MPWFRRKPPPPPPANTVVIDEQIASTLIAGGSELEPAVNTALAEYIVAKSKEAEDRDARGMPFWLRRDSARAGDIEDELRDRVIHRRSGEESSS